MFCCPWGFNVLGREGTEERNLREKLALAEYAEDEKEWHVT
jgi:hypothetical protein